jgi:hypothetical protein
LVVDANGKAGFQVQGGDMIFEIAGATHLSSLSTADFL